jgi:hypothetical protein
MAKTWEVFSPIDVSGLPAKSGRPASGHWLVVEWRGSKSSWWWTGFGVKGGGVLTSMVGQRWLPGAVSRLFELDGAGAPLADEGGVIDPHWQRWAGFVAAGDGEQSDGGKAESKSREHVRGGESEVGELSLCAHARDKDGWPMWDGSDRWCTITVTSSRTVSHVGAADRREPFKGWLWLSSGSWLHFIFSKIFNHPNLKFKSVTFSMSKICQNFAGR